jgi:sugar lactone lactonase YvrE
METNILTGILQSGGTTTTTPLADVLVTVYEATENAPLTVGTAKTDANGKFALDISRTTSDSIFYATASLGDRIQLVVIIGLSIPASITINELTTVAAAFSMAQFVQNGVIAGNAFGLRIAAGMNDNLVSPLTGASSEVLLSSPNGDETNSLRSTRALANLLAACVQQESCAVATLFVLATPPDGTKSVDTFQALVNIARHPANNVVGIYTQTKTLQIYLPSLERVPDAWTLAVKVNDSGSDEMLFGGPANIVFDHNGYAWVTNNVVQGTPDSARCIMVLKPNGRPSIGENGTPKSPITGGGLLGTGFGIDIDTRGTIWVGNFGWGKDPDNIPSQTGHGSVSQFDVLGKPLSGTDGCHGGTDRAQGTVSDEDNNIWIASYDNNLVVVFRDGDPAHSFAVMPDGTCPFDIAIAQDGSGWVTSSGGLMPNSKSNVSKFRIEGNSLIEQFSVDIGHSLKGMSLDSQGNAWIASGGDDAVYLFSPTGEVLGKFNGGGISCPWSATVDGDDNVWVANFGPMTFSNNYTNAAISKLAGANPDTRPPSLKTGDPISPQTGYTLPTGGSPVLLHNGDPLYGPDSDIECYSPLMRQTNCVIDQAGNVWAINNWKPDFNTDFPPKTGNPGGDGIVIFVGLAKPPIKKH